MATTGHQVPGFLVRLGHLGFSDFGRLPATELRRISADPSTRRLLGQALSSSPHLLLRFRRAILDLEVAGTSKTEAASAQNQLVTTFALELLREKAPPLYDALPWNTWDIGIVVRRYKLWRTKVLVQGEQAPFAAANFSRTAGLYVLEPSTAIRDYIVRKCRLEGVKRVQLLDAELKCIPLGDRSVDLAIVGPALGPDPGQSLAELKRVADSVLLMQNRPGSERILEDAWLVEHGFASDRVQVGNGTRPCWWRMPVSLTAGA